MLQELMNSDTMTEAELCELGGKKNSARLLRAVAENTDNLRVHMTPAEDWGDRIHSCEYVDVVGRSQTIVNVDSANFAGGASGAGGATDLGNRSIMMNWPNAPRLLNTKDYPWFRRPSWHNVMKAMVAAGSHISLAGPPSVGKDVGVEYLAAETGTPLVVVNGDGGCRRRDILGSSEMVNGTSHFDTAEAAAAIVNGWWLLITEVNAVDPDVLLLLNGVLAAPYMISIKGHQYPVHENFRLFISYNPGLVGTKPLPQSYKDRFFPIQIDFLSEKELRERLEAHGMPSVEDPDNTIIINGSLSHKENWPDLLVKFGRAMWDAHSNGKFRYQISVRRLIDTVTLMELNATGGDLRKAIRMAVLSTIDSPVEQREANRVLESTIPANGSDNDW